MKTHSDRTKGPGGAKTDAPGRRARKANAVAKQAFSGVTPRGAVEIVRVSGPGRSGAAKSQAAKKAAIAERNALYSKRSEGREVNRVEQRLLDFADGRGTIRKVTSKGKSEEEFLEDLFGAQFRPASA